MGSTNPMDRLSIDQLEQQFDQLHGNGNFIINDDKRQDATTQRIRKEMNSHDFKYSMIPFSIYNYT